MDSSVSAHEHSAQIDDPIPQVNVEILELLQEKRDEIMHMTNYLEALFARMCALKTSPEAFSVVAQGEASSIER